MYIFGGMQSLPLISGAQSRSISAENPRGERGGGGRAEGKLGPSRKGSPCIKGLESGSTTCIADIAGSGCINHIWMTVTDRTEAGHFVLRDLILHMYWDGEESPSVEVPLGDFFCSGFGRGCLVNSIPIAVNPKRGFNSYFPMPFSSGARITIENQHPITVPSFFYQIDYCLTEELPKEAGRFHAQWRRSRHTKTGSDFILLDGVRGRGKYVGTYLALTALERYWWGEGEMKFYIDGDSDYPTICGTGTEDYFGGAWSFAAKDARGNTIEETFCTPFLGYPYYSRHDSAINEYYTDDTLPERGLYRWHIMDPIHFQSDLRAELQQIGVSHTGLFERSDDVASCSYWYQTEPHAPFPPLPDRRCRLPR